MKVGHASVARVRLPIDEVLTQETCARILVEMVKFLAHQKMQVPLLCDQLKAMVERRRRLVAGGAPALGWQAQAYFRTASTAVDTLDTLFDNIMSELQSECPPVEACVLLGSTPRMAREAYRILLPPSSALARHHHYHHCSNSQKLVMKTLRTLTFSQNLHKMLYQPVAPTNVFVLIKRPQDAQCSSDTNAFSKFFLKMDSIRIPSRVPQAIISLDYDPTVANCCRELKIFSDFMSPNRISEENCEKETVDQCSNGKSDDSFDEKDWFQGNVFLKGFKDCCVNGNSVSDQWNNS